MLGQAIRQYREARGWKQATLAEKSGLTQSYISNLESGRRTGTLDVLEALATALDVPLADLMQAAKQNQADTTNPPTALLLGIWEDEKITALEAAWPRLAENERQDFWERAYQHQENRPAILEARRLMRMVDEAQAKLPPLPKITPGKGEA